MKTMMTELPNKSFTSRLTKRCYYPGCCSFYYLNHSNPNYKNKSFHISPKSSDRLTWHTICHIPFSINTFYVCEDHFLPSDYISNKRKKLKPGTIPKAKSVVLNSSEVLESNTVSSTSNSRKLKPVSTQNAKSVFLNSSEVLERNTISSTLNSSKLKPDSIQNAKSVLNSSELLDSSTISSTLNNPKSKLDIMKNAKSVVELLLINSSIPSTSSNINPNVSNLIYVPSTSQGPSLLANEPPYFIFTSRGNEDTCEEIQKEPVFKCCKSKLTVVVCIKCGEAYHKSCVNTTNFKIIDDARIICCEQKVITSECETNQEINEKLLLENNMLKKLQNEMEDKNIILKELNGLLREKIKFLESLKR